MVRSKVHAEFVCKLLIKWPTLAKLQKVRPQALRKFFYAQNLRGDHIEEKLELVKSAKPLTDDEVLLETHAMRVARLAEQLLIDAKTISLYDKQIEAILKAHADYAIVKSLPGAALHMQSRMIAALGTDRARFASAQALQQFSGIAPVTKKSGKTRLVHHRWACPKFVKQTFHEFAGLSLKESVWAKAYYQMLLSRGKEPQAAKRAVAYKWQRIIFRCWQNHEAYDEARYLNQLRKKGSPILEHILN